MGGGVGRSLSACLPTWRGPRAAPRVLPCSCPEKTDLCLRGQVRQVLARREPRSGQVRGGLPPSSLGPLLLLQVDQILIYPCFPTQPLRSPLALGYTRGHFSALVPPEPEAACGGAGGGVAPEPRDQASRDCFLPLMTRDRLVDIQSRVSLLHIKTNQRAMIAMCCVCTP